MDIKLTEQQLQVLDAGDEGVARVIDPRDQSSYILVKESEYAAVREALEDEEHQRKIRAVAMRNAVGRMREAP
jgi:hypothetical protein